MILKVENLGHLKEAQIDLSKDLIVLCGTNNSGKTYMAYSVFGLYYLANSNRINDSELYDNDIKKFEQLENAEVDLVDFYSENRSELFKTLLEELNQFTPSIFAANNDTFLNTFFTLSMNDNDEISILALKIDKQLRLGKNILIELNKKEKERKLFINVIIEGENNTIKIDSILRIIAVEISRILYRTLFNNSYIAPAERTAINLFSKELSIQRNNLVDKLLDLNGKKDSNPIDLLNRRASRYPLAIRQSLEIAEDLNSLELNKSEYSYFADAIEKEILGGKVKISKEGEVEFSPNSLKRKGLGIHLAGSMVKSLSSLVFYFRHLAQKNDFIIIDEPELNLHPDNQIKIAKLIVRFINAGFKVMISTHSDFIIRELNVLMMLKSGDNKVVANKLAKQYKYADDELLDFNKVGAYFFDNNKNTEIEVTNTGFEVSTIDRATIKQNEASQDIFLKLYND